ncbi:hypothetical protein [Rubrivivax gelatinosus]|uniref:hypothetical protein n=1 Tax=Rubrivivax gelatinosus TaxID=28068 RepID=UPI00067FEEB8|nr:hypothetical protein [Rubrivivax gelatinosus]MBG6083218.1 hypothetical protein [Rubrivivax gelatinosus]
MNIDAAQIAHAARKLQIPVPSENIVRQILTIEGTMLVRQLEEARKGSHQAEMYLRGVMLACHDNTISRLSRKGTPPSIAVLVNLGKAEGPEFGERVKEWAEAGYPGQGDLVRYVRLTLARELEAQTKAATRAAPPEHPIAPALVDPTGYRPHRGKPGQSQSDQRPPQQSHRPESELSALPPWAEDDPLAPPATSAEARCPAPSDQRRDPGDSGQYSRREHQGKAQRHSAPAQPPRVEADAPRAEGGVARAEGDREDYLSQHIYGGKAAACFNADVTRGGTHTVRIEAATSSGARQYDWQRKIALQLSQRELPLVLAVFMGWLPRFEGKGHGENNSKWFTLENQGNKLYLSVNAQGQAPRGVPIMAGDSYAVTTLLIRQMLRNDPFLSPEIVLSLVRKEAGLAQSEEHHRAARAAA